MLRAYMERHIEVDEGDHGPKAKQLLENICGKDAAKWSRVVAVAAECTHARIALWDAALDAVRKLPPQ